MDLDNIRPNFYEPIVNQKHTARPVWCDSQKNDSIWADSF